jgi:kynureninase
VGGGYKYCQLGEGNAFMRIPPGCTLRPVITGWFSEFDTMTAPKAPGQVEYGDGPARFAGSTYEPASHYRAAAVFDFFEEQGLTPAFLRAVSQHQVGLLARLFDDLDADPAVITRDRSVPLDGIGGFLALQARQADALCAELRSRGVRIDARGDILRLGPAPYLSDRQLEDAVQILGDVVQSFPKT